MPNLYPPNKGIKVRNIFIPVPWFSVRTKNQIFRVEFYKPSLSLQLERISVTDSEQFRKSDPSVELVEDDCVLGLVVIPPLVDSFNIKNIRVMARAMAFSCSALSVEPNPCNVFSVSFAVYCELVAKTQISQVHNRFFWELFR